MSEKDGPNNDFRKELNNLRNQLKTERINEVKQINDKTYEPISIEDSVRAKLRESKCYDDIIHTIKERLYLGKKSNTDFIKELKDLADESEFYEIHKYIPTLIVETYDKYQALFGIKGKSVNALIRVEKYIAHFFPDLVFNEVLDKQQNTKIGFGEDISTQTIWRKLMHEGVKTSVSEVNDIIKSDFLPRYHPFKEFFNALKWDGEDHIKKLCSYISTDDEEFFHQMLKKHLMRAVKCAIDDYYVNRFVFTLVSPIQELGKSTLIRFLNPFEKGMYYSEEPINAADKDAKIRLTQNFIYNLEELSSPSIKDIKAMKAIISQFNVTQRRAFRADDKTMARRCTFFGSTNESEFLIDDVNTRWLCFNIYDINFKYSTEIDVSQIYAQAKHLLEAGEEYELNRDEKNRRDNRNKSEFSYPDHSEASILIFVQKPELKAKHNFKSVHQIIHHIKEHLPNFAIHPRKLGQILKDNGFESSRARIDGRLVRGWHCEFISPDITRITIGEDTIPATKSGMNADDSAGTLDIYKTNFKKDADNFNVSDDEMNDFLNFE